MSDSGTKSHSNHTRTAVITGASKGIGLAIAHSLTHAGWNVIGMARSVKPPHFPGFWVQCDLADIQGTAEALEQISAAHTVCGVVNNVGVACPQPLESIDLETLRHVFDLNVRAAVQVTQHFVRDMRRENFGRVVNIASRAIAGTAGRTAYGAAKSALVTCTNTWAIELADANITVNSVLPGPIETELFRKARPAGSPEERTILDTILLNRIGTPKEVADAVAFFFSDQAAYITGQHLGVDGGRK